MKIFLFAASLRRGSYNKKLIRIARDLVLEIQPNHKVDLCEFNEFPMPMYDGDLESQHGVPEGVLKLAEKISESDAVIISSPEYNGSMPGTFKNAVDWVSRLAPVPFHRKQLCLIGASPGNLGAVRGNIHARAPFHTLGSYVYPDYFGLSRAHEGFTDDDQLKDSSQRDRLKKLIGDFLDFIEKKETPFDRLGEFLDEQKPPSQRI